MRLEGLIAAAPGLAAPGIETDRADNTSGAVRNPLGSWYQIFVR